MIILSFDIDNSQHDYARCMEFIQAVEEGKNASKYFDNSEKLAFFHKKLKRLNFESLKSAQGCNQDFIKACESRLNTPGKYVDLEMFKEYIAREKNKEFFYYFRVGTPEKTDVADIFFYVLMGQAAHVPKERMAVCILSDDEKDYYRFSHYLQYLPPENKNYYISGKNGTRKLDDTDVSINLFPILEIDDNSYTELTSARKLIRGAALARNKAPTELAKAITAISPLSAGGLGKSAFIYANNFIVYGKGNDIKSKERISAIVNAIIEYSEAESGITAIHYLLFAIMLSPFFDEMSKISAAEIKSLVNFCLVESITFADAVAQILENIVHHSDMKKGLFAMRLHNYNEHLVYLSQSGAEFNFTSKKSVEKTRYLQVLVGDVNQNNDIKGNFLKKYSGETEPFSAVEDIISMNDFFGEWKDGEASVQWDNFRFDYPAKCEGLLKFSIAIRTSHAIAVVRSSVDYSGWESKSMWSRDFRGENQTNISPTITAHIPGAQFNFVVPLLRPTREKDQTFMLAETYASYSQSLEIIPEQLKKIDTAEILKRLEMAEKHWEDEHPDNAVTQERKDWYWKKSQDVWNEFVADTFKCFIVNMDSFCVWASGKHSLWLEPFCKGFITSNRVMLSRNNNIPFYLKLNNCGEKFVQAFRTTARVNPYNLEKSGMQIRLEYKAKENKSPIFVGENYEITSSGLKYNYYKVGNEKELPPPALFPWSFFEGDEIGESVKHKLGEASKNELAPEKDSSNSGYCLSNTHIKLGDKVHIDKFYEMAPYLMRQDVAKEVAFWLLRKLIIEDKDFCELLKSGKSICIYGYAAYSRTIVNAMYEILKEYNRAKGYDKTSIYFIIYQPPQAGESVDNEEEVYLSDEIISKKPIDELAIIQVVPISSTLTTFKKLWDKLKGSNKMICLPDAPNKNLTVLWVRHEEGLLNGGEPVGIEADYWENSKNSVIIINSSEKALIKEALYVMKVSSKWQSPLDCELCYPPYLGMEFPLVSTDETSTIPSQQYYLPRKSGDKGYHPADNAHRVAQLSGFIKYGHISRASNHFQYYIDMQRFFRANKHEIGKWLHDTGKILRAFMEEMSYSHIYIVSPQKPNNIEFSQHVNNQCFFGKARVIYFDSEKHFRSNVEAEYKNYMEGSNFENSMFVYVDTAIDTGQTFHRISSLMGAIVPCEKFEFSHAILIVNRLSETSQKAYVRGNDSFYAYVNLNISNIHTYGDSCMGCRLKSNATEYYEAAATKTTSQYWQLKALKNDIVPHERWGKDNNSKTDIKKGCGFIRMLCTHEANVMLRDVRGKEPKEYLKVLQKLLGKAVKISISDNWEIDEASISVFDHPFCVQTGIRAGTISDVQRSMREKVIVSYIKALSRPFSSYDYKLKCCVADIFMFLVMLILEDFDAKKSLEKLAGVKRQSRAMTRKPLFAASNYQWCCEFAEDIKELLETNDSESVYQLQKIDLLIILLKALADMHMNFIYRKDVIVGVNRFLSRQEMSETDYALFYGRYVRYIMRVIKCGEDESRGLRLEYLMKNHCDYGSPTDKKLPEGFGLTDDEIIKRSFADAIKLLCVENNSTLFKGVKAVYDRHKGELEKKNNDTVFDLDKEFLREAHLGSFCRFLTFERSGGETVLDKGKEAADMIINECCHERTGWVYENVLLYHLLDGDMKHQTKSNDKTRYSVMQKRLSCVARTYFPDCKLILVAQHAQQKSDQFYYLPYEEYYSVVEPENKDAVKSFKKLLDDKENREINSNLDCYSFYIESDSGMDTGKIFIKLENNHTSMTKDLKEIAHLTAEDCLDYVIPEMQPVYILIEDTQIHSADYKTNALIRNILMYRYYLISWLEKDFNNDTMASIARISHSAGLLATDKAGDHGNRNEMDFLQFHLSSQPWPDELKYHAGKSDSFKWLIEKEKAKTVEMGTTGIYMAKNSLKSGRPKKTDWLLLHSYVNMKIGRLYRAMVDCEALGHQLQLDGKDSIYRTNESDKTMGRGLLISLKNVFADTIGEMEIEYETADKTSAKIDLTGLSRKYSLELLVEAVEIIVFDGKKPETVYHADDLKQLKDPYQFISFKINDNHYGYCSEFFSCILFEFCYSAIKHGCDWNQLNYASYDGGIGEKFQYFRHHTEDKRKIYIRREPGGELPCGEEYAFLVLESEIDEAKRANGEDMHLADADKQQGMSKSSMCWYFDSLWKRHCATCEFKRNEVCKNPTVDANATNNDPTKYIVKIPILKHYKRNGQK